MLEPRPRTSERKRRASELKRRTSKLKPEDPELKPKTSSELKPGNSKNIRTSS